MFRRLIAASLVVVSLLIAVSPALACATGAPFGDCCDPSQHSPCDDGKNDARQKTLGCVSIAVVSAANVATVTEQRSFAHPLDSVAPVVWFRSFLSFDKVSLAPRALRIGPISSGTSIYLNTGRLRL